MKRTLLLWSLLALACGGPDEELGTDLESIDGKSYSDLALQASNGHFSFRRIRLYDGRIAWQAYNGQYVVAEYGGGNTVYANRDAIGPWELFVVHRR